MCFSTWQTSGSLSPASYMRVPEFFSLLSTPPHLHPPHTSISSFFNLPTCLQTADLKFLLLLHLSPYPPLSLLPSPVFLVFSYLSSPPFLLESSLESTLSPDNQLGLGDRYLNGTRHRERNFWHGGEGPVVSVIGPSIGAVNLGRALSSCG